MISLESKKNDKNVKNKAAKMNKQDWEKWSYHKASQGFFWHVNYLLLVVIVWQFP